jgi:hypothetical protein
MDNYDHAIVHANALRAIEIFGILYSCQLTRLAVDRPTCGCTPTPNIGQHSSTRNATLSLFLQAD